MKEFDRLIGIVRHLRSEEGCPWDRAQTSESLVPYLLEEVHEFIESLDREDISDRKKELGDLFLHLVFQGTLAEERGDFSIAESLDSISDKLIRRHPHVFGDEEQGDREEMNRRWEEQKMKEGRKRILDGIPATLPTLHRSYRIQEKAAAGGFDWNSVDGVTEKIHEELKELDEARAGGERERILDETGDLLFSVVNLCRWLHINPDEALRKANNKFSSRFNALEQTVYDDGKNLRDLNIEELEQIWQEIKTKQE